MSKNTLNFNNTQIEYDGNSATIAKLWFKSLILTILTLGFYRFWGKTKLRQYIAGCHQLGGERFSYVGNAEELFYGFFRAIPYFAPIVAIVAAAVLTGYPSEILGFLYLLWLGKFFAYGALQYRTARTKWHGVNGSLAGDRRSFARKQFFTTIFSFGILVPYITIDRHIYTMINLNFGGLKGKFDRQPHKLISRRIYSRLLAIPSLGYSLAWYSRLLNEYIYNNTSIGNVTFKYKATTSEIYFFNLKCMLLTVFSLGLATPVVINMRNQFNCKHILLNGSIDLDQLQHLKAEGDAVYDDGAAIIADDSGLVIG